MSSNSHSVSTSPPPVEKFPPLSLGPGMHGRVERNLGGKYVSKIRDGRGSTEEREGISNFPVWVGPLPR